MTSRRTVLLVLAVLSFLSCKPRGVESGTKTEDFDLPSQKQGMSLYRPGNRLLPGPKDAYLDNIQPILAKKCVVCHACAESPCQLKLDSFQGLSRGIYPHDIYTLHPLEGTWTTNENQFPAAEWRTKGFTSVLAKTSSQDPSILQRAITAGMVNQPGFNLNALKNYQGWTCPATPAAHQKMIASSPFIGMPYGLPSLDPKEFQTLTAWLEASAADPVGPTSQALTKLSTPTNPDFVAKWDDFFFRGDNQYGPQVDLVGRYIYEHTYHAHIQIDESPGEFFELVRSRTPASQPLDEIFSAQPFLDPGIRSRVYYRLKKVTAVIARKNHIVWHLNDARLAFYKKLFFGGEKWWSGTMALPAYKTWNPFVNFAAIPAKTRYQWLLDTSHLMFDTITRGPICITDLATYVVADHFWVWFLDPDSDPSVLNPSLGLRSLDEFGIKDGDHALTYLKAYETSLRQTLKARGKRGLGVEDLWDGEKGSPFPNQNAWLTVMRHETNMNTFTGSAGGFPQSFWVMSFSNLERLYYHTVVTYRAEGSQFHKLDTFQYMSYLRQEAEDMFISFMPQEQRQKLRDTYTAGWFGYLKQWYDGHRNPITDSLVKVGLLSSNMLSAGRPAASNQPLSPQILSATFLKKLSRSVMPQPNDPVNNWPMPRNGWTVPDPITNQAALEEGLRTLTKTNKWDHSRFLPNVALLRVTDGDNSLLYSIIAHRSHQSHNLEMSEAFSKNPSNDEISILPGIWGNYPGLFLDWKLSDSPRILRALQAVHTEADWKAFVLENGIPRNGVKFWPYVEWLNAWQEKNDQVNGGILDLSEYYYDGFVRLSGSP